MNIIKDFNLKIYDLFSILYLARNLLYIFYFWIEEKEKYRFYLVRKKNRYK